MDQLLPDGIRHVRDLPYTLHTALSETLVYLSFEELPREEIPPKRIWQDGEKLGAHFRQVERAREEKWGGGGGIEDPVSNDAARGLLIDG